MKLNCDYCGTTIDTDRHSTCPHCGASYAYDDELLKEKERQNKLKDLHTERMRLENERYSDKTRSERSQVIFRRIVRIVLIALFIVFFVYAVTRMGGMIDRLESRLTERMESGMNDTAAAWVENVIIVRS